MKKGKFLIKIAICSHFLAISLILSTPYLYSEEIPSQKQGAQKASKEIAVTVNGAPITSNLLEIRTRQLSSVSSFHGRINDKQMEEIRNRAIDELITEELIYQDAKRMGIVIPEKEIDDRLKEIKKGYPSEDAFNKLLAANDLDPSSYKRLIERELLIKKVRERLFGKPVKLSNKEVKEYFDKNRERFREPEKIRLRQILIKLPPYTSNEGWEKGKKKAEDILTELKAGKDFSRLAKESSDDPSKEKGGDMGLIHRGRLEPFIEDIAFSMKVGEISDVIQTIYGYHIIKLEEKKEAEYVPYSRVKEKLKKDMEEIAMEDKKRDWIKGLKEKADIKHYAPFEKKE